MGLLRRNNYSDSIETEERRAQGLAARRITALLAVGLLEDGVAVRIDLVTILVALVAGRGDVVLAGFVLHGDDGRGDR